MMISRMNRLFEKHGKWAFGIFIGIIIISFVLYFSPGFSFMGLFKSHERGFGSAFGKSFSEADVREQIDHILISYSLKNPNISPENNFFREIAAPMAVERIILLRAAAKRGINIDNAAVASYLRAVPIFQKEGSFDSGKYELFVKNKLDPFRLSKQSLDDAVREELIIERLHDDITTGVIVTPKELRTAFDNLYEKFKVKTARFKADDYLSEVDPDEKSIESFFTANSDKYKIPAKYRAKIVPFNYTDYGKKVLPSITEENIKKYYELNKNNYKLKDEIQPLEKVKEKIRKELTGTETKKLAYREAQLFAVEAYRLTAEEEKREIALSAFQKLTEKHKKKSFDSDWFTAETINIKAAGAEPELAKDIAKMHSDQPISDAIPGKNAAFVAFLVEKVEERKAEFNEVKKQVAIELKREKAILLAREKARNLALKISESLDSGIKFENIEKGIKFEDVKEFDPMTPPPVQNGSQIIQMAAKTPGGRLSAPENTDDGALIVYLEKRFLPSDKEFEEKKGFFSMAYKYQKEQTAWQNFQHHLEKESNITVGGTDSTPAP